MSTNPRAEWPEFDALTTDGDACKHFVLDGEAVLTRTAYLEARHAVLALPGLLEAARGVIADHDERVSIYHDRETQPHRVMVMDALRRAIEEASKP